MITQVTIRNFKRFDQATIPLDDTIVLAGPNNAGKTTAIQALMVWRLALTRWLEKRDPARGRARQRVGVPITRPDMTAVPVREMRSLWHDLAVVGDANRQQLIEILVAGITRGQEWQCGMALQYQGPEMVYCRPMRVSPESDEHMEIPDAARDLAIVHLPPLAGIQHREDRVDERVLAARISEGRAGDILRNLLYMVAEQDEAHWLNLKRQIADLFQVELLRPSYLPTGEIVVEFYTGLAEREGRNTHPKLDIASGGSGFHQVLLLLAFLYAMPGAVLLFDEPDAHLEIIRQRDVYTLLRNVAYERGAQLIVASHSEVILDETAHDRIIAFVGDTPRPLVTPQEKSQLRKSLSEIRSADYLLARQRGAILYVEDYTDLDILREWAGVLAHPASEFLRSPFAVYIGNVPAKARDHFNGLRSARPDLRGLLLIDQTDLQLQSGGALRELMWRRREIENYLFIPDVIMRFCERELHRISIAPQQNGKDAGLLDPAIQEQTAKARTLLARYAPPGVLEDPALDTPFQLGAKMSDVVLVPFFKQFYADLHEYNLMPKNHLSRLAAIMRPAEIHPEVIEKLDAITRLTSSA
jgi:hypothetical protein